MKVQMSLKLLKNTIMEESIAKIMLLETLMNGGVSINLEGDAPTEGFMVSLPFYEKRISKKVDFEEGLEAIQKYIQERKDFVEENKLYFGMWNTETDLVLDISQNIEDKESAVIAGIVRDQEAIYDLDSGEEIFLPQRQKAGTYTQQSTYLTIQVREVLSRD